MSYPRLEKDKGVAVVIFDQPDSSVNVLSFALNDAFDTLLDEIANDSDIKAVVLISGKPDTFIAGADIKDFLKFESREEVKIAIGKAHELFNRIANSKKPFVAAMHGATLGGGLELAMACHYRIATNHPKTKLGLPEVNLGLLPGLGGTQRLPQLVGAQKALELILAGKNVYAKPAKKMGLVDALMHKPGLLSAAKQAAEGLASGKLSPKRKKLPLVNRVMENTPLQNIIYQKAEETVLKRTKGNYPAPLKIIKVIKIGQEKGMKAGIEAETNSFAELIFTPQSKALIHLFFSKTASEKNPYKAKAVDTVGMLGAGLMGSGIAQISAQGGYNVLLKDLKLEFAAKGKGVIWKDVSKRVGKGMTRFERDTLTERITPVETYQAFDHADLVIEAVLEDINVKHEVMKELEVASPENMIFASNTSAIPISDIAKGWSKPENVIGMHYFSPAQKMPLLEIIKTDKTADWVLATAVEVGLKQGKTVIVVGDGPGFYANRVLAPYMNEALTLLKEGASIEAIDKAMTKFGFPVGPLKLLDEVGIDVGAKVNKFIEPLFAGRGIEMTQVDDAVLESGIKGRKSGKGFYLYEKGKKSRQVNKDIYTYFGGSERKDVSEKDIQERLLLAFINEALLCLEEGLLSSPKDGDIGAVFGVGFPPFLGGPFFYSDQVGAVDVLNRLEKLEEKHGVRFKPAEILREYATLEENILPILKQKRVE